MNFLAHRLDFFSWIYSYKKRYERISEYMRIQKIIQMNIRIYLYQKKQYEWISEYIRIKNDTNMIRTNVRIGKYLNIFEYTNIRHTLIWKRTVEKKLNKCNQCNYASSRTDMLRRHWKTHNGEKSNKCNKCVFISSRTDKLSTHLKTHSGEKPKNASNATMHLLVQAC